MSYCIRGLSPEPFMPLFGLDDEALAANGARRVVADADSGFPCRVSLEEASAGETLILLNFVSNEHGPYRTAHAIFVREGAVQPEPFVGRTPPVFAGRTLSLRGFTAAGELVAAAIAGPDAHERTIRELLDNPEVDHIDAHNAARGCFAARIERCKETV